MDLWGVSATLFAAASLAAVLWQIRRTETLSPRRAWRFDKTPTVTDSHGVCSSSMKITVIGPFVAHEIRMTSWGRGLALPQEVRRARMDCDAEPIEIDMRWRDGDEFHVGVTWFRNAAYTNAPVQMAVRLRVDSPAGGLEHWHWSHIPWRNRGGIRCGKFLTNQPERSRRNQVPTSRD